MCDHTTLDLNDIEVMDNVGRDHVTEGIEVYYNPNQVWYFVDHQRPEDVVVFCNTDSRSLEIPCTLQPTYTDTAPVLHLNTLCSWYPTNLPFSN